MKKKNENLKKYSFTMLKFPVNKILNTANKILKLL